MQCSDVVALIGAFAASDGRTVDLHPVTFVEDGTGIQEGLDGNTFSYAASGFSVGLVDGHPVPCLSIDQQLQFRKGYELRPVDHHDLALLDRAKAEWEGTA
jgi:lincosamide nucleotidyltransferase A/C/D/E